MSILLLQFLCPHHVLRPRDRYRTIAQLFLIGVLPEPVHAALSDAEISTITHLARVPGKELPQEAPSNPVPVCPPPALADLHDAHPHPGFTMRQHSAHLENSPVVQNGPQLSGFLGAAFSPIATDQYNQIFNFLRRPTARVRSGESRRVHNITVCLFPARWCWHEKKIRLDRSRAEIHKADFIFCARLLRAIGPTNFDPPRAPTGQDRKSRRV